MAKFGKRSIVAGAGIGSLALLWGTFRFSSYCVICGTEQHGTHWQIPLTHLTYWRSSSVTPTTLSRSLLASGLVTQHAHDWAFAAGGGNGVMCAIGQGRHLGWTVSAPEPAVFVDAVLRYRSRVEANEWRASLLDVSRSSSPARSFVETMDVPKAGFATRAAFDAWWTAHRIELSLFADTGLPIGDDAVLASPPSVPRR